LQRLNFHAILRVMKNKKAIGDILSSGEIRRIQAEIADDTKLREQVSERISSNKALLEAHDAAVAGAARLRAQARPARRLARSRPTPATKLKSKIAAAHNYGDKAVAPAPVAPAEPPKPAAVQKFERGGGSYSVVIDILQGVKEGLPAAELREKAAEHPEASDSLKKHPSYIYSILEQLRARSEVEKLPNGRWRATNATAGAVTH
jgi:hypothetical protein